MSAIRGVQVDGDRLRVPAGRAPDLAVASAFPFPAAHAGEAIRAPVATVTVRHADARGEGWMSGWCSPTTAVVALAPDEDGLQELLVRPVLALPALLARLLGLGPRPRVERAARFVDRGTVDVAIADGDLTSRWTVAVDRLPAPPGAVSVVDSAEGFWQVEPVDAGLRLRPWTSSRVWDELAAACAPRSD
jgi:hypothetical protein